MSSLTENDVPKSLNESAIVVTPTQPLTSVLTCEPTMCSDNNVNSGKVIVKPVNSEDFQDTMEHKEEVNYFRCGNNGCDFGSSTSAPLKSHLVICDYARQTERLKCVFCARYFKQSSSLLTHLQIHGPDRFECSVCHLRGPLQSRIIAHMKYVHSVSNTDLIPVDILKQDLEKHQFIISPKLQDKRSRGCEKSSLKPTKINYNIAHKKTKFSPEELEEIPAGAIFYYPLGCSLCSYETKVRSNLIRHMALHSQGDRVSHKEVVNPVPEKTEKMFDKMMNLASSCHKKKVTEDVETETEIECPYKYVPDQSRYMCHVLDCGYRTLSETMLRDHVNVIHKEETSYICPHCPDKVNIIPIDQLGLHLKLHDSPLYKCSYCDFCGHIRRTIEKHQSIYHVGLEESVKIVRSTKPDLLCTEKSPVKPMPISQPEEQGEKWYSCDLCKFKTKKKKIMVSHGITDHLMNKPFKCSMCDYEGLSDTIIKNHFKTNHPNECESCQVVTFYKMITELKTSALPSILPLWKRDAKRIKLIRGITLDEKGDAPPPVATCVNLDMSSMNRGLLKYGLHGSPTPSGCFLCPRCSIFQTKGRNEFREHLYKHFEYKPVSCSICEMTGTQKTKIIKHISKSHNIETDQEKSIKFNINEELEAWIETTINKQMDQINELGQDSETEDNPVLSRKRRRLSVDLPSEAIPSTEVSSPLSPPLCTPELDNSTTVNDVDIPLREETELILCDGTSPSSDDSAEPEKKKKKRNMSPSLHRFRCCHCKMTARFKSSLSGHSKKMHPNLPVQILPLPKTSSSKIIDGFICSYCSCISLNQYNMKVHWTKTHRENNLSFETNKIIVQSDVEYQCFWCQESSDIHSLKEHCKKHHSNERFLVVAVKVSKYKCSDCSLVFNSLDILRRHFSMDHSSKFFTYVVLNTPKYVNSPNKASPVSSTQTQKTATFKCPKCYYTCILYKSIVRHLRKHFSFYLCCECEGLYHTALKYKKHMQSTHPGSSAKPVILNESESNFQKAKRDIIIISVSGSRKKISDKEIADGEKEYFLKMNTEMYSYDEPLEDMNIDLPRLKETARKSTGGSKQSAKLLISPGKGSKQLNVTPQPSESGTDNAFLNFRSNGGDIKVDRLSQQAFDMNARCSIDQDQPVKQT